MPANSTDNLSSSLSGGLPSSPAGLPANAGHGREGPWRWLSTGRAPGALESLVNDRQPEPPLPPRIATPTPATAAAARQAPDPSRPPSPMMLTRPASPMTWARSPSPIPFPWPPSAPSLSLNLPSGWSNCPGCAQPVKEEWDQCAHCNAPHQLAHGTG